MPAFNVWIAVQTQWRHGFNGPSGLDYAGVRAAPAFRRTPAAEREALFEDLCVMERATLREFDRMRQERQRK